MSQIIEGGECLWPESDGGDGFTARGRDGRTIIRNRVFNFLQTPQNLQDEVLSGVEGAVVCLERCLVLGGIKAILAGNGDHPCADMVSARWDLTDCVIIGAGRRCPEAQDGTTVTMRRCWVHDWGRAFDKRAFGAWAHRGSRIAAEDCMFTQSGGLLALGLRDTVRDVAHHISQAVLDSGPGALLRFRTYLPGVCRGLSADTGGLVLAARSYRNRWWIRLEGCKSWMSRGEALALALHLEAVCPDARKYLGKSLSEIFAACA